MAGMSELVLDELEPNPGLIASTTPTGWMDSARDLGRSGDPPQPERRGYPLGRDRLPLRGATGKRGRWRQAMPAATAGIAWVSDLPILTGIPAQIDCPSLRRGGCRVRVPHLPMIIGV